MRGGVVTQITLPYMPLLSNLFFRFESGVSNKVYERLMGKYEANPDDPMSKFSKVEHIYYLITY